MAVVWRIVRWLFVSLEDDSPYFPLYFFMMFYNFPTSLDGCKGTFTGNQYRYFTGKTMVSSWISPKKSNPSHFPQISCHFPHFSKHFPHIFHTFRPCSNGIRHQVVEPSSLPVRHSSEAAATDWEQFGDQHIPGEWGAIGSHFFILAVGLRKWFPLYIKMAFMDWLDHDQSNKWHELGSCTIHGIFRREIEDIDIDRSFWGRQKVGGFLIWIVVPCWGRNTVNCPNSRCRQHNPEFSGSFFV